MCKGKIKLLAEKMNCQNRTIEQLCLAKDLNCPYFNKEQKKCDYLQTFDKLYEEQKP
jgi:hypothetical protein